jgi:zinc and cadmium transporter
LGREIDVVFLLPFAAGNFIYIAASDLIPEIKHSRTGREGLLHFVAFVLGAGFLLALRVAL